MIKVKFTLQLAMKAQTGEKTQLYSFFNPGATWRWVVNATPRALYPAGKRPGTHRRGGWVGPRAGLDGCRKSRQRDSIPGQSSP